MNNSKNRCQSKVDSDFFIDKSPITKYTNCTRTTSTVKTEGGKAVISINYRDPRPIYEQVRDKFRQMIISGALPADYKMPSVRELAAQLAINPNTIQKAYKELETEGYIFSVPGRGSFVCRQTEAAELRKNELLTEFDEIVKELELVGIDKALLIERMEGDKNDD